MIEIEDKSLSKVDAAIGHGFFDRRGGVSAGIYDSLNCAVGSQDEAADIQENRERVAQAILGQRNNLVTINQIHSADCAYVEGPFGANAIPDGDALVTDKTDLVLAVLTADCGPVLFAGKKADGSPVLGAAHAGWGGALKGVCEATVKVMIEHGGDIETIRASIGPCIGPKSYEVSMGFEKPFLVQDDGNEHFFKGASKEGHLMFDLPGYIASRLAKIGLKHVSITGADTFADEECYFSYRRTTHRGEPDYGRQISAICIKSS
jgi:YfiH family protein